jgi:hypothetical protein
MVSSTGGCAEDIYRSKLMLQDHGKRLVDHDLDVLDIDAKTSYA